MEKAKDLKNIVNKFFEGESTPVELNQAINVFSDPYHNLELRPLIYELWQTREQERDFSLSDDENQILLDKIHHNISLNSDKTSISKNRKIVNKIIQLAAVLVIGLVIGVLVNKRNTTETKYLTTIVPMGAISQVVLPDGTIIYLNAGTELRYSGSEQNGREVYLSGEAWFDVKTNKKNPFVVHTPFYNLRVTGTRFNLKAYTEEKEIVTTLEEGCVEVLSSESLILNEHKILLPGEQLIYNRLQKSIQIEEVNPGIFSSWKDNQLIFINMNLKELIVLLERKYGVSIETPEQSILNYHYDGTISDESILEVLDLIKSTLPVKYKIEGQTIVIEKE